MSYTSLKSEKTDFGSGKKKIIFNAGSEAVSEYGENRKNFSPSIQLLFSPFGLPFVPIEIIGTNLNEIISNMVWTKDRNNSGGILQIEIVPDATTIKKIVDVINKYSKNLYSKIWGELGVDLEDLFKPMTLCQLWIDGYHVMEGTVRSCIRNSSVTNTDKEVSYSLTIDELGNLYNMNTMSLDTILLDGMPTTVVDAFYSGMEAIATAKGVTLGTGIYAIINAFLATTLQQNFSASDGFPLSFRLIAQNNPVGGISNLSVANFLNIDSNMFSLNSTSSGQSSVWSFLKNLIPSPWMEFFTESGGRTMVVDGIGTPAVLFPGFNYVVSRTTPYSNPLQGTVALEYLAQTLLFDLTAMSMLVGGDFVIITDDVITDKTLCFDSINQSTVFRTKYSGHATVNAADKNDKGIKCVGPLNPLASGGIKTFGIREMAQSVNPTSLIGLGVEFSSIERIAKNILGISPLALSKNHFSTLLATWFRNQSRMREGTVTVRGLPYARPGMYCLYLPSLSGKKPDNIRDIGIYYIDSLDHDYSIENESLDFTTTLNLIRGVPLPTSIAQTALLLFDFEILPPESGLYDGAYTTLKNLRAVL